MQLAGGQVVAVEDHLQSGGMVDQLSQDPGADRRFGFRRWALDTISFGFYIPIMFSGSAKQRGEVVEQRRHLLLDEV
jgi:hypothetical protein